MILYIIIAIIGIVMFKMGLFRRIYNSLKKITERGYFKVVSPEQLAETTPEALREENAILWNQVQKFTNKVEELTKKVKFLTEGVDKETKEKAKEEQEKIDQEKKRRKIRRFFDKPLTRAGSFLDHTLFYNTKGYSMPYIIGLEFERTNGGTQLNFILSKDKRKKNIGVLELGDIRNFHKFFHDPVNLVEDLKKDWILLNITPDGKFIYGKEKVGKTARNGGSPQGPIGKIKRIDVNELLEHSDPITKETIMSLYTRIQRAQSEKMRALKSEKEALWTSIDATTSKEAMEKAFDRSTATLEMTLKRLDKSYDKLASTRVMLETARMKQRMSKVVERELWKSLRNLSEKVSEAGVDVRDLIKRDIRGDIKFAMKKVIDTVLLAKKIVPAEYAKKPE